jgi:hypothetical protein
VHLWWLLPPLVTSTWRLLAPFRGPDASSQLDSDRRTFKPRSTARSAKRRGLQLAGLDERQQSPEHGCRLGEVIGS